MAKGKKRRSPWLEIWKGPALSLGLYLAGLLLVALLILRGTLPEERMFPVTAALCGASAFCGGLLNARRPAWGTLPGAMASAGLFALVLLGAGLLCSGGVAWTGRGGGLLLCALGGGLAAGVLSGGLGGGRRKKRGL